MLLYVGMRVRISRKGSATQVDMCAADTRNKISRVYPAQCALSTFVSSMPRVFGYEMRMERLSVSIKALN